MLKDDVELISGRLLEGSITAALYTILKDSPDFALLCRDLNIEEVRADDTGPREHPMPCPYGGGGFNLAEWLAHNAQPVSL